MMAGVMMQTHPIITSLCAYPLLEAMKNYGAAMAYMI
jgi:hypothetical protein